MGRQVNGRLLPRKAFYCLQSRHRNRGIVGHTIGLFVAQVCFVVSRVAGQEVGDVLVAYNHGNVPPHMTGRRYEGDPTVFCNRMRYGERADRRPLEIDKLGFQPDRPALREATRDLAPDAFCNGVIHSRPYDAVSGKMIKAAGVIMMPMCNDHGVDVCDRVEVHRLQSRADLLVRRDLDVNHPSKEGIPPGKIAGNGVAPGVTRIDQKAAFRVFDQDRENRN